MKRYFLWAALALAWPGLALALTADPPRKPNQDEIELMKLARIYERAINEDDIELLTPFLDAGFEATSVTRTRVTNADELRALWKRVKEIINRGGKKGTYKVEIRPETIEIAGGKARIKGESREEITTGDGWSLRYRLQFDTDFVKGPDGWRMRGLQTQANLLDTVTVAARTAAIYLWRPRHKLKAPDVIPPDWDNDRGANDKDAAAAMSVPGDPKKTDGAGRPPAARSPERRNPPPPLPMTLARPAP